MLKFSFISNIFRNLGRNTMMRIAFLLAFVMGAVNYAPKKMAEAKAPQAGTEFPYHIQHRAQMEAEYKQLKQELAVQIIDAQLRHRHTHEQTYALQQGLIDLDNTEQELRSLGALSDEDMTFEKPPLPEYGIDGEMGPETNGAMAQVSKKLQPEITDEVTNQLHVLLSHVPDNPSHLSKLTTEELQKLLKTLALATGNSAFDPGSIDKDFGKRTQGAYQAFMEAFPSRPQDNLFQTYSYKSGAEKFVIEALKQKAKKTGKIEFAVLPQNVETPPTNRRLTANLVAGTIYCATPEGTLAQAKGVSGGYGRGAMPGMDRWDDLAPKDSTVRATHSLGEYARLNKPIYIRATGERFTAMQNKDGVGSWISVDDLQSYRRYGVGIHPDGNGRGSLGCFAVDLSTERKFFSTIEDTQQGRDFGDITIYEYENTLNEYLEAKKSQAKQEQNRYEHLYQFHAVESDITNKTPNVGDIDVNAAHQDKYTYSTTGAQNAQYRYVLSN